MQTLTNPSTDCSEWTNHFSDIPDFTRAFDCLPQWSTTITPNKYCWPLGKSQQHSGMTEEHSHRTEGSHRWWLRLTWRGWGHPCGETQKVSVNELKKTTKTNYSSNSWSMTVTKQCPIKEKTSHELHRKVNEGYCLMTV